MIEIKTRELNTRKKVLIDGHPYVVRRLGAGDELALSQILRRLNKLQKKAEAAQEFTDRDEQEFQSLQEQSLKIYASTFDDGEDGTKALALVSNLSFLERSLLYEQIFGKVELERDSVVSDAEPEAS